MQRAITYGAFSVTLFFSFVVGETSGLTLTLDVVYKKPGESFVVRCNSEMGNVMWTGPRGPLNNKTDPTVEINSKGALLYSTAVTETYSGNYTCSSGKEKKVFQLKVTPPLTFMDTRPLQTGKEGNDVTLRCEVKGGDKPIISWYVEGGDLNPPKYDILGDGLVIRNVTRHDSKTYICKATQIVTGDVKDKKIELKVQHKPYPKHEVWVKVEQAWGYVGSIVNLTCEGTAEPPPQFMWYANNNRSINKQDVRLHQKPYESTLVLDLKDTTVFGTYKCIVSNKYGSMEKMYNLLEGVRPDPPEYIELTGANAELLDLGIRGPNNTVEGMEPIGYDILYRLTDGKSPWKTERFKISQENSYPLMNLHHNSKYEVQVATRNIAGLSNYTSSSFFDTLINQADCAANFYNALHLYSTLSITLVLCW